MTIYIESVNISKHKQEAIVTRGARTVFIVVTRQGHGLTKLCIGFEQAHKFVLHLFWLVLQLVTLSWQQTLFFSNVSFIMYKSWLLDIYFRQCTQHTSPCWMLCFIHISYISNFTPHSHLSCHFLDISMIHHSLDRHCPTFPLYYVGLLIWFLSWWMDHLLYYK